MKTVSFAVPCYNSAEYMDKCISSILKCGEDIEVIIVNDGSTKDNTSEKAHEWEALYPDTVRVIDKENGGHGSAVNAGLREATGLYFKVVDSDDWLDELAMIPVMRFLRLQMELRDPVDMVIANYVYEKVHEHSRTVMHYRNVFPVDRVFTWDQIGHFKYSQYLLMHSVIYRTSLLQGMNLTLPEHCFYVDNIFVYEPLPYVKSLYYMDVDMYRYFIGREDQSINEKIMLSRVDHQLKVTRQMIDAVCPEEDVSEPKLVKYMEGYLTMMMAICNVFLRMNETEENERKRDEIWAYLLAHNPKAYKKVKSSAIGRVVNLPSHAGRNVLMGVYHTAQKVFKFN